MQHNYDKWLHKHYRKAKKFSRSETHILNGDATNLEQGINRVVKLVEEEPSIPQKYSQQILEEAETIKDLLAEAKQKYGLPQKSYQQRIDDFWNFLKPKEGFTINLKPEDFGKVYLGVEVLRTEIVDDERLSFRHMDALEDKCEALEQIIWNRFLLGQDLATLERYTDYILAGGKNPIHYDFLINSTNELKHQVQKYLMRLEEINSFPEKQRRRIEKVGQKLIDCVSKI